MAYEETVAGNGSNAFVPLTDPLYGMRFAALLEALFHGNFSGAMNQINILEGMGAYYILIEISNSNATTYGVMEDRLPGEPGYLGWGAFLVHPDATDYVIYQTPHVFADLITEDISLNAFYEHTASPMILLAGAHRDANGDDDGDGWPDADVAHDPDSLFHLLTDYLAQRGLLHGSPYWFCQIHGSADRETEPTIVGSDCSPVPFMTETSALVLIDDQVDATGFITMGVWGWVEGPEDTEDGDYYLNGVGNIQSNLLNLYGLRGSFMHFEIERHARDDYLYESGPGYDGILHLMSTIKTVLANQFYVIPTPTPTSTAEPFPTATPFPKPLPSMTSPGIILLVSIITTGLAVSTRKKSQPLHDEPG